MATGTPPFTLRRPGASEWIVLAIAVLMAALAASATWFTKSPLPLIAMASLPLAAAVSLALLGATGSALAAATVSCFLLMNRIDEGIVLPFGGVSLKASYWFVMLCAAFLYALVLLRRLGGGITGAAAHAFVGRYTALLLGFAAVLLIGAVFNHAVGDILHREIPGEFLASISILAPMLFVPLIVQAPLSRRHLILTVQAVLALGGLAGLIMAAFGFLPSSLINALGWASANQGTAGLLRGRLPLGHPNAVAAVIILLMPVATVFGIIPGGRIFRVFYLGCALFMFAGVLFSLARSALLVTIIIVALTVGYVYFGRGRKTLMTYFMPAFFAIALVGVTAYLFLAFDFSRFWSRGYYEEATKERRLASMRTALVVFGDYPVFGATPDALYKRLELRPGWEPAMEDTISPIFYYRSNMTAETPHNLYLTVLAETGLLGAIFFFGAIGLVFRTLLKLRQAPHLTDEQRHALMAFLLGLAGFLLMGVFESLLMVGLRTAYLFWMMAGLALRYGFEITRPPAPAGTA